MTNRPDVSMVVGETAAIVNGDRAAELIDGIGVDRCSSWIGLELPLTDLERARAYCRMRGWRVVEHGRSSA